MDMAPGWSSISPPLPISTAFGLSPRSPISSASRYRPWMRAFPDPSAPSCDHGRHRNGNSATIVPPSGQRCAAMQPKVVSITRYAYRCHQFAIELPCLPPLCSNHARGPDHGSSLRAISFAAEAGRSTSRRHPPRKPPAPYFAWASHSLPRTLVRGQEVTDAMHRARYRSAQTQTGLTPAGLFADPVLAASASPSYRSPPSRPAQNRDRRLRESITNGKENAHRRDPCGGNPRGRRGRNQGRGI
jgi:hypothetical protein